MGVGARPIERITKVEADIATYVDADPGPEVITACSQNIVVPAGKDTKLMDVEVRLSADANVRFQVISPAAAVLYQEVVNDGRTVVVFGDDKMGSIQLPAGTNIVRVQNFDPAATVDVTMYINVARHGYQLGTDDSYQGPAMP